MVFRELSFSRLECGVHDRLHIYPLCGIFDFPWHRHQIEGTNGFYCLIRKTERFTISNVESQVFTPNNSRLDPGSNPGCPRDKRMSYHWTNCASLLSSDSPCNLYLRVTRQSRHERYIKNDNNTTHISLLPFECPLKSSDLYRVSPNIPQTICHPPKGEIVPLN